jgi:hypothetical protein
MGSLAQATPSRFPHVLASHFVLGCAHDKSLVVFLFAPIPFDQIRLEAITSTEQVEEGLIASLVSIEARSAFKRQSEAIIVHCSSKSGDANHYDPN